MPEITRVTSEALQATVRRLLPSQQGFGDDLQATNLITPVIDLTPTAEGSVLQTNLQQALAFGNANPFSVFNSTSTIVSTTGFHRISGTAILQAASSDVACDLNITDGASSKVVWSAFLTSTFSTFGVPAVPIDLVIFLDSGESASFTCGSLAIARGSVRQIADKQGNLINPVGFTFE